MKIVFFGYSKGIGTTFHLSKLGLQISKYCELLYLTNGFEQERGLNNWLSKNGVPVMNISYFIKSVKKGETNLSNCIFHCNGFSHVKAAAELNKVNKKNIIINTVHSFRDGYFYGRIFSLGAYILFRNKVKAWVFPSQAARNRFFRYTKAPSNTYIIPLGIESEFISSSKISYKIKTLNGIEYDFNSNISKQVIYLANFQPNKRHKKLIKAFSILLRKSPNYDLLLFGDGPELKKCMKLCKKESIEDRVYFFGRVSRNIIPSIIRKADLSLLISKSETFSHAIIESVIAKTPIICTDVGIAREYVHDFCNGFIIPTDFSKETLVSKIEELSEITLENNRDYTKELSWQNIAKRYFELYNLMVEQGS